MDGRAVLTLYLYLNLDILLCQVHDCGFFTYLLTKEMEFVTTVALLVSKSEVLSAMVAGTAFRYSGCGRQQTTSPKPLSSEGKRTSVLNAWQATSHSSVNVCLVSSFLIFRKMLPGLSQASCHAPVQYSLKNRKRLSL